MGALCRVSVPAWDVLLDRDCLASMHFCEPSCQCVTHLIVAFDPCRANWARDTVCAHIFAHCLPTSTAQPVIVHVLACAATGCRRVSVKEATVDTDYERAVRHTMLMSSWGVEPGPCPYAAL